MPDLPSRIFVVEDEEDILELIRYNLVTAGYQVETAMDGDTALERIKRNPPQLVLLDLLLPGADGGEICRKLKKDNSTKDIPVIMVTAKSEESDIVRGLDIGAEDYVTKPFSIDVLLARIRSALRRSGAGENIAGESLEFKGLKICPGRHEVFVHGKPVELTASEFKVLQLLSNKPGWVFTRSQIVESIRGNDYPVTERSIDVVIVGLRKKLADCSKLILTVRGMGYKFIGQ